MSTHKLGRVELHRYSSILVLSWRGPVVDVRLSVAHAPGQPLVVALSMHRQTVEQRAAALR
jgi:hypothetical protein